jgi:class 3 adenylate cyclase
VEKTAARIRSALDAMVAAALAEGGATCRVAGSGLVAVFGIPPSRPDAAECAVRAARAMREACRSRELDLRAGIEHGRVLAGNVAGPGGFDLCVAGDAADIADQLLAAARPGEILAGAGAAANSSALERAGTREVGGVPADVFRA